MNSATPTPSGTAMSIAMTDEATVVQSRLAMPNRGLSPATVHSVDVRKLAWSRASDGMAWERRKTAIRVTIAITRRPAPVAAPPKTRSPSRPVEARSPPSGLAPCGFGLWSTAEAPVTLDMSDQLDPSGEGVDGGGHLGGHVGGQGCVADGLQGLLLVGRGELLEEPLEQRDLGRVLGLGAGDLVGHQDDRVGPGLLGGVVQRELDVVALTDLLGGGHGLAGRVAAELDRAGAVVDLRHAQTVVLGRGPL